MRPGKHRGYMGKDAFPAAALPGYLEEQLPVVPVRQHHKERRSDTLHLNCVSI